MVEPNEAARLRRLACQLMMLVCAAWMTARIFAAENVIEPSLNKRYDRKFPAANPKPSPTYSSNDRARWATVRALVDEGTWVIGKRINDPDSPKGYHDEGILFQDGYGTIDVVLRPDDQVFFGTKPPLLTILVAGEYQVLKTLFGWDIDKHRWQVVCTILVTLNVLPFLIYLVLFLRLLEEVDMGESVRVFTFACACFGTFLLTFSNTLNNHTVASFCVLFALYPWLRARPAGESIPPGALLMSGVFAGLAGLLDLPSCAFAGMLGLFVAFQSPAKAFLFAVGFILPMGSQMVLNHHAYGTWKPVYAQFGGPWYEFAGSHWSKLKLVPRPAGIDFAEEPGHIYAFHLLLGHHGWFSLTPIWFIALVGLFRKTEKFMPRSGLMKDGWLRLLTGVVAIVVIAYYIWKTNNYGGFTSGPRWLFWLTPLFLLHIPAGYRVLERSRLGRNLALLCLSVSVFSVAFPVLNPWRHPWLLQLLDYTNLVRY